MPRKEPNAFLIRFRIALSHSRVKISSYVAVSFTGENRQEYNTSDENISVLLMLNLPEVDLNIKHCTVTFFCEMFYTLSMMSSLFIIMRN